MWLVYIIQALAFTYIAFLIGRLILRTSRWHGSTALHTTLSITLGYGGVAIIGLILALCGWLNQACLYTLAAIILVISYKIVVYHIISWTTPARWKHAFSILWNMLRAEPVPFVLITIWIIGYTVIALSPTAMGKDGLAYHLPFALEISQNHHISFPVMEAPEYGQLPLLGETLYAVTLTLFNNLGVLKLIQLFGYLLLIFGSVALIKEHVTSRRVLYVLTALLLACMPIARNALSGGMIDIWPFLFGIVSLLLLIDCLTRGFHDRRVIRACLLVSGILLGFALGTKYLALFFGAIGVVEIVLMYALRKRPLPDIMRAGLTYVLPALIIGGFWYLKNLLLTGNPFFPIFASGGGVEFASEVGSFVMHRTWYNFFLFPFYTFGTSTYHLPFGIFTALSFALTYALLIFFAIKKKLGVLFMSLFIALEIYLGFVFIWSHQIRFIIPALILNGYALIVGMHDFMRHVQEKKFSVAAPSIWIKRTAAVILVAIIIVLGIASAISFKQELTCMSSKNAAACHIRVTGSEYYVTQYINTNLVNTTVIEYYNVYYRYSTKHGNTYTDFFCSESNDESIGACLKKRDALYYIDDTKSRNAPWMRDAEAKLRTASYFLNHGHILFEYFDPTRNTYIRLYGIN